MNKKASLHPVKNVWDNIFNTLSRPVFLDNPTVDMISIEDIACSLGNLCRFGGHVRRFYSVAQHSVIAAELLPPRLRLAGLLHDAAEAYVGDVIKPLKIFLGDTYRDVEAKFEKVVCEKFGISLSPADHEQIKKVDHVLVVAEHESFQLGSMRTWHQFAASHHLDEEMFHAWLPGEAEARFLMAYSKLTY